MNQDLDKPVASLFPKDFVKQIPGFLYFIFRSKINLTDQSFLNVSL